jgi:hypothetical protein
MNYEWRFGQKTAKTPAYCLVRACASGHPALREDLLSKGVLGKNLLKRIGRTKF